MWSIVMMIKATTSDIVLSNSGAMVMSKISTNEIKILETIGSPIHPKARLEIVIPNCVAARYESKCVKMFLVKIADLLPACTLASNCDPLTFTIANSAATKKPLRRTKKSVIKIDINMSMDKNEC